MGYSPRDLKKAKHDSATDFQDKDINVRLVSCHPMDCSPPGSSLHGISQARTLEWVAIPFSKGSSQPRDPKLRLLHWQVGSLPLSHTKVGTLSYLEFIFVYGVQEYSNFILVFTVQGTSEVGDRWVPGWKFTISQPPLCIS